MLVALKLIEAGTRRREKHRVARLRLLPRFLDRAFERATGASPFKIPESWIKVKDQLDMHTPFCISTNNDIVGGNSGSPLIDVRGNVVGLMFDGNIDSIAGSYWFDAAKNRAIAVHPAIIREALDKVYGAKSLLAELGAS